MIAIGAAILFILIGSIAFPAESETAIFLFDHTAKSLFAPIYPFTIQNALYVMFAFGVGDLWVRYRAAAREKAYLDLELLPEGDEVIQINQLGAIRRRIAALDAPEGAFLPQLIDESILQLQNSKSLEQTVSIYTSMLELITHRLDLAYQTIRYLVWIIPTTGFIGTVVGIARRCAPSLRPTVFRTMHGLRELLARGYVVTATDYPGLGTTGPHPYLVGVSEGRAVLDSVRAARNFRNAAAGERYALWGHSQGGHAVLFAGEISERYAPELKLAGIAAAAPATELGPLIKMDLPSITGKILGAYALKAWSEVFGLSLADIVLQRSMLVFDRVAEFCNETYGQDFSMLFAEQPLEREGFLAVDILAVDSWARLMRENTPKRETRGLPVFIAQGSDDSIVHPRVTAEFVRDLCRNGTPVTFVGIAGGDHDASAIRGAKHAVRWIKARFEGRTARNQCGQPMTFAYR